MKRQGYLAAIAAFGLGAQANAATMLYVHDYAPGDDNIVDVLQGDGYTVDVRTGGYNSATYINTDLLGDLSAYDAIFWNATADGYGLTHATGQFTDLLDYVMNGGFVFVTGYDSIASPTDSALFSFVGGLGSIDFGGERDPLAVTGANALSTGVKNIIGLRPTGAYGDWDTIFSLGADTTCVAASTYAGGCQWSLRSLGDEGMIAYISAGASGSGVESAWTNTSNDGSGAYNAALRNFAYNATLDSEIPLPAAALLFPMGLAGLSVLKRRKRRQA